MMHRYSTEWIIIVLVLAIFGSSVYTAYRAGHLWILLPCLLVALLIMAGVNRLKSDRSGRGD